MNGHNVLHSPVHHPLKTIILCSALYISVCCDSISRLRRFFTALLSHSAYPHYPFLSYFIIDTFFTYSRDWTYEKSDFKKNASYTSEISILCSLYMLQSLIKCLQSCVGHNIHMHTIVCWYKAKIAPICSI